MRIAVAASGLLGLRLLAGLEDSSHEVVLCIQDGRKTRGVRRALKRLIARLPGGHATVLGHALRRKLPVLWLDAMSVEELAPIRELDIDVVLVGGFGIIFKEPLLSMPRVGCVNTHSSLLPLHRGPNPFAAAVIAGDTASGVTFHGMDAGIDTGPILYQTTFDIGPRDTAATVYRNASGVAGKAVANVMEQIARDGMAGTRQPKGAGCYDKRIRQPEAEIDWSETAEAIDRRVRGLSGTQPAWFRYRGKPIKVLRTHFDARPVEAEPGTVVQRRPDLTIATGLGRLHIRVAYRMSFFPWLWPMPWSRPKVGRKL